MESRSSAHAVPGRRLVDDRYFTGTGTFSPEPRKPDFELTLIERDPDLHFLRALRALRELREPREPRGGISVQVLPHAGISGVSAGLVLALDPAVNRLKPGLQTQFGLDSRGSESRLQAVRRHNENCWRWFTPVARLPRAGYNSRPVNPSRPIRALRLAALCLAGLAMASASVPAADDPAGIDFVRQIQPIFAAHCYDCHGPAKQKSTYRLDEKIRAIKGGDSGHPAIIPGQGAASPLVKFVTGEVADTVMPPKGDKLSAAQIALLKAWIDQGAVWPESASAKTEDPKDWWSLRPLARPPVPQPTGTPPFAATSHPVDAFIRAKLAGAGLAPSPEADRRTLLRRVTFDLLGLPPTPAEVAAFVADTAPMAYERLVDRLLASPHYGERWARHWLDVVHYGDTHGYDKDKPRPNAWPYRDYVIRAFNEDRPYTRFVQEQLAGDVYFPDAADGLEALGFIAAGPWDFIGHAEVPETKTDGKIARHLDRDDMVSNTIGTFASLTIHCAQCHDHKFDPIPQEDYYRLQSVFAAVDRTDRKYHRESELNRRRSDLEKQEKSLRRRLDELKTTAGLAGGDAVRKLDARISAATKGGTDSQPPEYGYHSEVAARPDVVKWVQVDLGRVIPLERVVLAPARDAFAGIGDGFGFPPRYKVEVGQDAAFTDGVKVIADLTAADVPKPGVTFQTLPAAGHRGRFIRVTATQLAVRSNDYIFALAELEVHEGGTSNNVARGALVTALDSIEAPARWARQNLTDGKSPSRAVPPEDVDRLRKQRTDLYASLVPRELRAEVDRVELDLKSTKALLDALPAPLTAFVGTVLNGSGNFRGTGPDGGRPRPINLLPRGDVTKPGRPVGPGSFTCVSTVPAVFDLPADHPEGARRAALAAWLTHPDNPLTWRSAVNRVWQRRFGRGLVETPNDFGRMGARPSHPELLDWLAVEFRDAGQSFKSMDRLLVTSATYRQGSPASPEATRAAGAADPENHLLSRMTPRRIDAEAVRDSVLAVSGKLDPTMYGPGFQDFVVEKPDHSPHYEYHLHDPEDPKSHRRSVYRFLVRSQQEPFMVALDCADPSMRVDRRNETLTPLQALALLNSKLTVAMARHFAARVEKEADERTRQIEHAFQLALQRSPTDVERRQLVDYSTLHGMASACRLLFNLNEFVFVD